MARRTAEQAAPEANNGGGETKELVIPYDRMQQMADNLAVLLRKFQRKATKDEHHQAEALTEVSANATSIFNRLTDLANE